MPRHLPSYPSKLEVDYDLNEDRFKATEYRKAYE